jgi:NADH-ubiquinone oxidoreductase chain 5
MKDQQDVRKIGGLVTLLPFTYAAMAVASLSLIAMPYLSGNSSKDLILELAASHVTIPSTFMWLLGSLVAGITACYSIRLLALTFFGEPNANKSSYQSIHEQPIGLIIPMTVLSILAIFFGYLAKEPLAGMASDSVDNIVYLNNVWSDVGNTTNSNQINLVEAEFGLNIWAKNVPLISTLIGTIIGIFLFVVSGGSAIYSSLRSVGVTYITISQLYSSFSNKWWIDAFFARAVTWPILNLALFGGKTVDRGFFELFGSYGLALYIQTGSNVRESTIYRGPRSLMLEAPRIKNGFIPNIPEYALYVGIIALGILLFVTLGGADSSTSISVLTVIFVSSTFSLLG